MRLWSIHPKYLDIKGLVVVWREALLAKKVLEGKTKGYKNYSQLLRFKNSKCPLAAINSYLCLIFKEAVKRGYEFDSTKACQIPSEKIKVTNKQLKYEFSHLKNKLKTRAPENYKQIRKVNWEYM